MNNLKRIMDARGITPTELAAYTGMAPSNIRRLMEDDNITTAFAKTKRKIAEALDVSVKELVEGGESIENKILYSEIVKATENLASLMRRSTDKQLYLNITIFSRDDTSKCDGDPSGVPDYYNFRLNFADEDFVPDVPIMSEASRVYYSEEDGKEGIRKVIPFHKNTF